MRIILIIIFSFIASITYGQKDIDFSDFVVEKNFSTKVIDERITWTASLSAVDHSGKNLNIDIAEFDAKLDVPAADFDSFDNGQKKDSKVVRIIISLAVTAGAVFALSRAL